MQYRSCLNYWDLAVRTEMISYLLIKKAAWRMRSIMQNPVHLCLACCFTSHSCLQEQDYLNHSIDTPCSMNTLVKCQLFVSLSVNGYLVHVQNTQTRTPSLVRTASLTSGSHIVDNKLQRTNLFSTVYSFTNFLHANFSRQPRTSVTHRLHVSLNGVLIVFK